MAGGVHLRPKWPLFKPERSADLLYTFTNAKQMGHSYVCLKKGALMHFQTMDVLEICMIPKTIYLIDEYH